MILMNEIIIIFFRTFINININLKKFHHSLKIQCLKIAEIREEYINLEDLFIEHVNPKELEIIKSS